jgi:hypothetical protein
MTSKHAAKITQYADQIVRHSILGTFGYGGPHATVESFLGSNPNAINRERLDDADCSLDEFVALLNARLAAVQS